MAGERPRRVLLTADSVGGVFAYAVELARALAERRIEVVLAVMGGALRAAQWRGLEGLPGVAVHEAAYRLEWMPEPWTDVARAGRWLLALERAFRPDLVHLNQFAFGALPFRAPKLVVAHSCVLSWWRAVHGCDAPSAWQRYRDEVERGLAAADAIAAPTRAMLDSVCALYGYDGPAEVLPNGRNPDTWRPQAKEDVILSAGRLWDEAKNLAALESVATRVSWPIRVAGPLAAPDGGTRCAEANVEVLGELAADDLRDALARAAIYALPARYEPFGLSALEAGLCGCALVLGDIPSLREVWGEAALFVAPDDHDGLAQTLARLVNDPALRAAMGERARERARHYSAERMAEAYLAAYRRLLEAAPTRASGGTPRTAIAAEERACAS